MCKFTLVFLTCLICCTAASQTYIGGSIHLEDGDPAAGAIIQLLGEDSVSLIKYTVCDSAGQWSFQITAQGIFFLQVNYLGCLPYFRELHRTTEPLTDISILLEFEKSQLKSVEVRSERIGLIIKGDTIYYNLQVYIDSTEYNLGDVLQKLPQISVDNDGSISYKGQRVDIVLTEGKDIFGQLHKQMTEGIRASDVKSVQIIERFKEGIDHFKQTDDDKVALNIQLTEEAKSKISGNVKSITNFYNQYEVVGTAYHSNKKVGFTTLFRSNNTGQPVIAPLDVLQLIDFEHLKIDGSAKMEDLLPDGFITPIDTKRNNDIFGSARIVADPKEGMKIKAMVYFAGFSRYAERLSIRNYLDSNTVFTGIRQSFVPSQTFFTDFRMEYKNKKGYFYSMYLPFTLNRNCQKQSLLGSVDENEINNDFNFSKQTLALVPNVKLGSMLNHQHALSLDLRANIYQNQKEGTAASEMLLFDTQDTFLRQKTISSNYLYGSSLTLQSNIKKNTISYTVGLDGSSFHINSETNPTPALEWNTKSSITTLQSYTEILNKYEGKKIRYNASVKVASLERRFEQYNKHSFLLPSGKAGLYFNFNKMQRLFLHAGIVSEPVNLQNIIRFPQIKDPQTLTLENLDSCNVTTKQNVELNYIDADAIGNYNIRGQLRYIKQRNSIIYQTKIVDNYFINSSLVIPETSSSSAEVALGYKIKKWHTQLKVKAGLDATRTYSANDNELYHTSMARAYSDFSVDFSKIPHVLLSPGIRLEQNRQSTPQLNFKSKYRTGKLYLDTQIKTSVLFVKTNISYQTQAIQRQVQNTWLFDLEVEYSNPKIPFKLSLTGRNLLNFYGTPMLVPDFNSNYIGFERFTTIGGQVLAGINYMF